MLLLLMIANMSNAKCILESPGTRKSRDPQCSAGAARGQATGHQAHREAPSCSTPMRVESVSTIK